MARYTLGINCSHVMHFTVVIGDNATLWRRHQSGDLPFFRDALTAGIGQHIPTHPLFLQSIDSKICYCKISLR